MAKIVPDPISLTTHHLHLCFRPTDAVLSSGTGFIVERNGKHYLVTNWHNVSGRSPVDGCCLSDSLAIPDMLSTSFRAKDNLGTCIREHLPLYFDEAMLEPVWYEHPTHGHKVDVVAIPIQESFSEKYSLFPINCIDFDAEFKTEVADDAFVVGYPFSDTPAAQLPIWKRASIASEPDVNIDGLPKLLVDTATRSGLSGSPVIMQRIGIHGATGLKMTGSEILGRIRNFIGVYSGRVGSDETKAQLGVIWKASVVNQIIDGRVLGRVPSLDAA